MKLLKISFAALIAVATLGITLTSQAGLLNNKIAKAAIPNDCYREVTVTESGVPTIYDASAQNPITGQCIQVAGNQSLQVSGPSATNDLGTLSTLVVTAGTTAVDPAAECDPVFLPYCCFQVENDRVTGICFGDFTGI